MQYFIRFEPEFLFHYRPYSNHPVLCGKDTFILFKYTYTVLSWASPLACQIIGHSKTIIILITKVILYDDIPTGKFIFGRSMQS
jgi:hypothetical protein